MPATTDGAPPQAIGSRSTGYVARSADETPARGLERGSESEAGSESAVTVPLDEVCAAAVELARGAAAEVAGAEMVGEHEGVEAEDEHVVTHYFACRERGYVGWRWAVTVVRAPDSDRVTVNDVVLLPGAGALLPPPWIPWTQRLRAGDVGVGDVAPTAEDDPRLEPAEVSIGDPRLPDDEVSADLLLAELWLGRRRVLSPHGRSEAAQRWYAGEHGPRAAIARAASYSCGTCGFLVPLSGALGRLFGVCANEVAPDDGKVVSFDHGCGAHSEALVVPSQPHPLRPSPGPSGAAVDVGTTEGGAVTDPSSADAVLHREEEQAPQAQSDAADGDPEPPAGAVLDEGRAHDEERDRGERP